MIERQLGAARQPVQKVVLAVVPTVTAAIAAGCGLFVLGMTLRMVAIGWSPVPFSDEWDELVTGRALSWSWLVSQHNEHRLFVSRLIYWLDRWLVAETHIVDLALSFLMQTALCGLLTWLALKDAAADKTTKVWTGGLCLALLFWAVQYENFLLGMNVSFFGVILFAASAFTIVAAGPATALGAGSAVLSSGAAAYTLASGIVVPPLALILGLWVGRPRWYLLVLLIAAIGWPASYLWGYTTPSWHSDPAQFFTNFTAVWNHFFIQVGAPFTSAVERQPDLRRAARMGAVAVAGFGGGLLFLLLRSTSPQQKALTMLSIYLLGGAFLAALGRVRFGPEQALSPRYTTPIVTFWLSSFLLWFSAGGFKPRLRVLTLAVGALIAMTAALSESRFFEMGRYWVLSRKLAMPALVAGINDPSLTDIYPYPDAVLERRAALLQFHTSVFAEDWTRLMGANFADNFTVNTTARCLGSFERVQPIDETASNWSAVGAAWREGSDEPLRRIVLTTDDGPIVGYGLGGFDSSSVNAELKSQSSSQACLVDRRLPSSGPGKSSRLRCRRQGRRLPDRVESAALAPARLCSRRCLRPPLRAQVLSTRLGLMETL